MRFFTFKQLQRVFNRLFILSVFFIFQPYLYGQTTTINPDDKGIIYVDINATTSDGDGSSWDKAIKELADALLYTQGHPGLEIWVKKGTYHPLYTPELAPEFIEDFGHVISDRDRTFVISANTKIYGGFSGVETSIEQRNIKRNKTVLSGDLDTIGNDSDNSYHVVVMTENTENIVIDGFTIQDGNANGHYGYPVNWKEVRQDAGGGIYMNCSTIEGDALPPSYTVMISNVEITNNKAEYGGGGVFTRQASIAFNKVIIDGNYAYGNGGGVHGCCDSKFLYTNSLIKNNTTMMMGGGIYNEGSEMVTMINVTVTENEAQAYGAGIDIASCCSLYIYNSIIWGNKVNEETTEVNVESDEIYNTLVKGLDLSGINNSLDGTVESNDPLFDSNYIPTTTCVINRGDESFYDKSIYGPTDIRGVPRIIEAIDLGAFETKSMVDAHFLHNDITTCDRNPQVELEIRIDNGAFFPFTIKYKAFEEEDTIVINDSSELTVVDTENADGIKTYLYNLHVSPTETTEYTLISISEGTDEEGNKSVNPDLDSSASVTINAPIVNPITGSTEVCIGSTITLENTTTGGVWSSNNHSVAIIDATGTVKGITAGTAIITYDVTNASGCTTSVSYNLTVTSEPIIGQLPVPTVTCPGSLLSVSKPAISLSGSTLVSEGWILDGKPFNPSTDVVGLDDNGRKLVYWVTNSCGTAKSNEVAIAVSSEGLKVKDIGIGCDTVVDLNMAVVSTPQGSTVAFYRNANDNEPIQNPAAVVVSNNQSTTFYAKAIGGSSNCVTHEILSFKVTPSKATQKITFEVISPKLIGTPDFDPMATASSGLTITYTSSNPEVAIIVNGNIHIVGVGTTIITASQSGNECFLPAEDVSRELNVIDSETGENLIPKIEIDGQPWADLSQAYIICESNITSVHINLTVPSGATVDKGLSFDVAITQIGMTIVQFTVRSKDGSRFETFNIYIDKRVAFESIVKMRWNNTFAAINNPTNNGGYSPFIAFKWFKNEEVVGTEQYYSVNNLAWEKLNPQDLYYLEVETEDGKSIRTCYWNGILDDFSVSAYPNPVQKGGVVYVEATRNEMAFANANIELYTFTGTFISRTKVTGRTTEIPMNEAPGVYVLKFIGENDYVRSFKIIIKE